MAPRALTILEHAAIALPIAPYADAGPLYGLVLPILISPSDAPGSYFFSPTAGTVSPMASTAARREMLLFMGGPRCFAPAAPDGFERPCGAAGAPPAAGSRQPRSTA